MGAHNIYSMVKAGDYTPIQTALQSCKIQFGSKQNMEEHYHFTAPYSIYLPEIISEIFNLLDKETLYSQFWVGLSQEKKRLLLSYCKHSNLVPFLLLFAAFYTFQQQRKYFGRIDTVRYTDTIYFNRMKFSIKPKASTFTLIKNAFLSHFTRPQTNGYQY